VLNFTLYALVSVNKMLLSTSPLKKERTNTTCKNIGRGLIIFPSCRARRMDQLQTQGNFCKDNKRSLQRPAICQILIVLSDVVKYPISTSPVYCSK